MKSAQFNVGKPKPPSLSRVCPQGNEKAGKDVAHIPVPDRWHPLIILGSSVIGNGCFDGISGRYFPLDRVVMQSGIGKNRTGRAECPSDIVFRRTASIPEERHLLR